MTAPRSSSTATRPHRTSPSTARVTASWLLPVLKASWERVIQSRSLFQPAVCRITTRRTRHSVSVRRHDLVQIDAGYGYVGIPRRGTLLTVPPAHAFSGRGSACAPSSAATARSNRTRGGGSYRSLMARTMYRAGERAALSGSHISWSLTTETGFSASRRSA